MYQIKEEVYTGFEHKTPHSYSFSDTFKRDTLSLRIPLAPHNMDTIISGTFTPIFDPWGPRSGQLLYVAKLMSFGLPGIVDVSLAHLREEADSCLYEKPDWSKRGDRLYLKNIGGPYYSENTSDWFMGNWTSNFFRKLIYYNNSQGTWGTPYPFPLGLNKNHHTISDWVKIYPNPAKDWIQVSAIQSANLSIYDLQGRMVYEAILSANENTQIPCSEWNAGVYIVKATSEKGTQCVKVVVSR